MMVAYGPARRWPPMWPGISRWSSPSRPVGPGCVGSASRSRCPGPGIRGRPPRSSSGSGKDAPARRLDELRRAEPGRPVELWAEDEARLGLKPIMRRVWSPRGQRPTANGRAKYEWLYLYAFVHPASGRNLELIIPRLDTAWMSAALEEFATWADPGRARTIVLLVDNAGWHVAKALELPP